MNKTLWIGPSLTRRMIIAASIVGSAILAPMRVDAQQADSPKALAPLKVIDPAYMNRNANACVDFFQFANGTWLAHDTIPAAYSSSGVSRDMSDRNELVVRSVLDDALAKRKALPPENTTRKLGTFYATCMDSSAAEQMGAGPITSTLSMIDRVDSRPSLLAAIANLQMSGSNVAFGYSADPDPHDAAHYLGGFGQGGLGLPDREYYTKTDPSSDSLRTAYVEHIAKYLALAGADPKTARSRAARVLTLETELAKASMTRVAMRDPSALDHPMTLAQFRTLTPNIDWTAYFKQIGLTVPTKKLNVAQPDFFKRLDNVLISTPIEDWRAYLRYHAIASAAPWLSTPFVQEDFAFSSRFTGAKALLPRWKRCLRIADRVIGEALGQAYVAKTFSPTARARAKTVIDDIRAAFGQRIQRLDWMSAATKKQAMNKLALMGEKVGYPNTWRD